MLPPFIERKQTPRAERLFISLDLVPEGRTFTDHFENFIGA